LSQCTNSGERQSLSTLEMKLWSSGLHPATFMTELPWLSHNNDNEDKYRNKDNTDDNHNSSISISIHKAQ
jgi:hypothetical protein